MSRRHCWSLAMALGMVFLRSGSVCAQRTDRDLSADYNREIRPLLSKYCFSCHGSKKVHASLNLETLNGQESLTKTKVWKNVWGRVRTHQMPPPERAQPAFADRQRIVAWIEEVFVHATLDGQRDPGPLPARRLNVREMMHSLRDLVVTNAKPSVRKTSFAPLKDGRISLYRMLPPPDHPCDFVARMLPQDTNDGGFDTIADNLSMPPFLMEGLTALPQAVLAE